MVAPSPELEWLRESWKSAIREKPTLNVWEWAAEHLVFTKKMGNIEGAYDPGLTPFTKLFQEAVTNDFRDIPEEDWWLRRLVERGERVDEAFVVKSSQSGFTQAALNATVYLPLHAPGRLLYVLDSKEKAKKASSQRLIPFLKQHCESVIADDDDVGNSTFIELANMIIELGGSYSSGLFSEKPLKYAFADDVEYMVSEKGVAGMLDGIHVIDHIRSRFTTADECFMGVFSKPNLETSEFIVNARSGSLHRFWVRCKLCGERQVLEPEGLNYEHPMCKDLAGRYDFEAVEALTTYRCAICKGDIEEKWKTWMNNTGIWIPKSRADRQREEDPPLVPRRLSMQVSDLNSPFKRVRWGILARLWIEAQNNPAKLKYVVTNHFARPWKEKAISLRAEQVKAVCAGARDPKTGRYYADDLDADGKLIVPEYSRGECPFRPVLVSATSDVQGDKYKWGICGWQADGTCAVIEYGACLSASELYEMMSNPRSHNDAPLIYLGAPDAPLVAECGLIDSGDGNATFDIYSFCVRTGWLWYPSKGVHGLNMSGRLVEAKEDFYDGEPILRYHYNDHALKVHLYKDHIQRAHDPKRIAPRLYLPRDIEDEFITELISESLQPVTSSGNIKRMIWVHDKKIGPNDWGDMLKTHYAIWQIMGPGIQAEAARAEGRPPRMFELKAPPPPQPIQPALPIARPATPDLARVLASLRGV
jgi:hypothetical protein